MITKKSFIYALRGLAWVLSSERNARFHLLSASVVVLAAVVLSFFGSPLALSSAEFAAIIFAIFLVFIAEIFNSAIEIILDLVRPNPKHPGSGAAKDMAAGAVLVAATGAILVGLIVFLPRAAAIFSLIFGAI